MENETLITILRLQEENTIYRRAITDATLMIGGFIKNAAYCGMPDVDDFLKDLYKLLFENDDEKNKQTP